MRSIKDVYVLHNMVGNSRNSYVAMTRDIEEVKLYYNRRRYPKHGKFNMSA
ncbi:MAG: hypothetical protein MRQ08_04600 [Candidatus Midichloria mitochondrii]|nr:hypothetical protein [Candidatus Midichloria mitochondrii]